MDQRFLTLSQLNKYKYVKSEGKTVMAFPCKGDYMNYSLSTKGISMQTHTRINLNWI